MMLVLTITEFIMNVRNAPVLGRADVAQNIAVFALKYTIVCKLSDFSHQTLAYDL